MNAKAIDFYISIGTDADTDPEELWELSQHLKQELFELDCVRSIKPIFSDKTIPGAKIAPVEEGNFLVTLAQAGAISALITVLGSLLGSWLARDKSRRLELTVGGNTLKLSGLSKDEQQELLEWFQIQAGLRLDH